MISIKEIKEKKLWENFNLESKNPSFLQSWAWGEFQHNLSREFHRLGVYDDGKLVGISLIYSETAKLGSYFYCPAGPVFKEVNDTTFNTWVGFVKGLAKDKNSSFLRVEPRILDETEKNLLIKQGFTPAPEYTQPQCSALIDLTKSEEELKSNLSSSTRYNVNAASRKGVKVREGKNGQIDLFINLLKETAGRKNLVLPATGSYHKKQFETLGREGLMELYTAEVEGRALSAALVVNYGDTSYYLHAANSLEQKEFRASYPLVWFSITEAKKAGGKVFDFWGVAPTDDPNHPWSGVTAFKFSFGAEKVCYDPPYDLPFTSNYQLMKVVELWRRPVKKLLRFGRN